MICDICGKNSAKERIVTRSYGSGDKLMVIEDIPAISCSHCGESYFTSETLHEIERIKVHRDGFTRKKTVPVAIYT